MKYVSFAWSPLEQCQFLILAFLLLETIFYKELIKTKETATNAES
jgi:hypothetical protein